MQAEERIRMAEKHLEEVIVPIMPPPNFDPLTATNKELIEFGFPPRPHKETHPIQWAKWEKTMSRPISHVHSKLHIAKPRHLQIPFTSPPLHDPMALSPGVSLTMLDSSRWAGAIVTNPANQTINSVSATWTIQNPYPPPTAYDSDGNLKDGKYYYATWIGLDGFDKNPTGSNTALWAGTRATVEVKAAKVTSREATIFYQLLPAVAIELGSFTVVPGDIVSCLVCAPQPNMCTVAFLNVGTSQTVFHGFPNVGVAGTVAGFIVGDPDAGENGPVTLPADYGSTVIYDAIAGSVVQVGLTPGHCSQVTTVTQDRLN
jgi:hypothetical protein